MKKIMFAALAAVAAFSSCTNDEALVANQKVDNDAVAQVGFGAYHATSSRAGVEDYNSIAGEDKNGHVAGFGVFAYSQMDEPIASYTKNNFMPNFMYNQKVAMTDTKWQYSPVKYWPNNPGAMLSFYAYAPYMPAFSATTGHANTQTPETNEFLEEVKPVDSLNTRLILGYDYKGPGIEYRLCENVLHGVDLLWGEYISGRGTGRPNGVGNSDHLNYDASSTIAGATGKAAVDLLKQKKDSVIFFQFHHALSRINFNVQVWNDSVPNPNEAEGYHDENATYIAPIAPNTTIKIQKVELIGRIPTVGTLRLYDGSWNVQKDDYADVVIDSLQFNPIVRDGLTGAEAKNEIDLLKGRGFMKDGAVDPLSEQSWANNDNYTQNYVMLIPGATFHIRITYDVITVDPKDPRNSSTITNVINSTDSNALAGAPTDYSGLMTQKGIYTLKAGYAYNFHLNLGMTSVKFAADVDKWIVNNPEVVLPKNEIQEP